MLLPPDPNSYPTTIQGDLQYQHDLKVYEIKAKSALNETNYLLMRDEVVKLRARVAELENHVDKYANQAGINLAARRKCERKILNLESHNESMHEALNLADEFIRNGIEFGYVRMPDEDLKGIDKAHDIPEIIRKALALK